MSYGEFLLQWYNLVFLAAGALGAVVALAGRSREEGGRFLPAAAALATALVGLTLNGAIHDLRLGDPASHFWWVLPVSRLGLRWARNRWFPPVRGVRFNPPGQEGVEAKVVSSSVDEEPASGRAQWQDEDGVLTLVKCHTREGEGGMGFGADVEKNKEDEDPSE
ncbi:MAG: hypothetical protein ABEJ00_01325, partial [Gemmatimonadota bacterium]